jgi:hypothetical protein
MAAKKNPDEIVHIRVNEDETVIHKNISYGPRATLQVRRGDLDRVDGKYAEVHPHAVPDAAERK